MLVLVHTLYVTTLTYDHTEMRIPYWTNVSPETEEYFIKTLYQDI